MQRFLDKHEDQLVSSESFCTLANIVLKHSYFELRKDVYHQILGTAVRTKFAPHYGNIFMTGLGEHVTSRKVSLSALPLVAIFRCANGLKDLKI